MDEWTNGLYWSSRNLGWIVKIFGSLRAMWMHEKEIDSQLNLNRHDNIVVAVWGFSLTACFNFLTYLDPIEKIFYFVESKHMMDVPFVTLHGNNSLSSYVWCTILFNTGHFHVHPLLGSLTLPVYRPLLTSSEITQSMASSLRHILFKNIRNNQTSKQKKKVHRNLELPMGE